MRKDRTLPVVLLLVIALPSLVHGQVGVIVNAAARGDLERVQKLIEKSPKLIDQPNAAGTTPLAAAARGNHIEVMEVLLKAGADVDAEHSAALIAAAKRGHVQALDYLLEQGGVVNRPRKSDDSSNSNSSEPAFQGSPALKAAIDAGHPQAAWTLLKSGAEPGHLLGATPLPKELFKDVKAVQERIKAVVKARRDFISACIAGRADDVTTYLKACPLLANQSDQESGSHPLELAVANRQTAVVKLLLDAEVNIDRRMSLGRPIGIAVKNGDLDMVNLLAKHGANLYVQADNWSNPPLYLAVGFGHRAIVEALIQHKASVNAPAFANQTCLMLAARKDDLAMVKLLLKHKANAATRDNFNSSALHEAAVQARTEIIDLLLKHDANPIAVNREGVSPLWTAARAGRRDVVQLMAKHIAKPNVLTDALIGAVDRVAAALKKGKECLHHSLSDGSSLLHIAAQTRNVALAKLLIEQGADLETRDHKGRTPLHGAVVTGDPMIVSLLIEHKANVNAQDKQGNRPVYLAPNGTIRELLEKQSTK